MSVEFVSEPLKNNYSVSLNGVFVGEIFYSDLFRDFRYRQFNCPCTRYTFHLTEDLTIFDLSYDNMKLILDKLNLLNMTINN